ncbi:MAG: hypothetical protein JNK20_05730 [Flavipsychrobacter sp.]|jgi:hypothetical protein|nr:hypothetical protein [Flavipsychrobacter sp.]
MSASKKNQQAVLITIACLLFFNFPLLSIANQPKWIGDLPLLLVYLFSGWLLFIFLIRRIHRTTPKNRDDHE